MILSVYVFSNVNTLLVCGTDISIRLAVSHVISGRDCVADSGFRSEPFWRKLVR